MSKIVRFLNNDAGIYTSARDRGDGKPVTDVNMIDENGNSVSGSIEQSAIIVPVDIQTRYSKTFQTYAGQVAPPKGSAISSWIDVDGFDKVGITAILSNDSFVTNITVRWSHDGSTVHGEETNISTGSSGKRAVGTDTKARYMQIQAYNGSDTLAQTVDIWAYLKA